MTNRLASRTLAVMASATLLATVAACDGNEGLDDCVAFCEAGRDCANPLVHTDDCQDYCDQAQEQADDRDCGDEWDELHTCMNDNFNCDATSGGPCSAQSDALSACRSSYCDTHPDAPECHMAS